MEMHIEDGAMGLAAIQYLERQGVPYITNRGDLQAIRKHLPSVRIRVSKELRPRKRR
jgi:hypothetical protein